VARFTEADIARLLQDEGIVSLRAKIQATIAGARIYLEMQAGGKTFATWVWNLAGGKPIRSKAHRPARRFPRRFQSSSKGALQIRRSCDCLRVDAGRGNRQRP